MRTSKLINIGLVVLTLYICGCNRIAFMNDGKTNISDTIIVTPIDDPQLAKLIIKPNQKAIEIPRDPFKPIYNAPVKGAEIKKIEPIRNNFSDVYFIGMVKMDDQAIALVKVSDKKVMLKLKEQYKGFIVKEINNTHIIFSNGENQITLKRGAKK